MSLVFFKNLMALGCLLLINRNRWAAGSGTLCDGKVVCIQFRPEASEWTIRLSERTTKSDLIPELYLLLLVSLESVCDSAANPPPAAHS
jgi:hypothetical protein